MKEILSIQNISKRYGRIQAVSDLTLTVEQGDVFGLLGPNGSGKTTTLGIVLDIVNADTGKVLMFGEPSSAKTRRRVGSLLETPNFYGYLSAERNLKIVADIKGIGYSDIDRVLQFVNLSDRRDDKFKYFSLGMKQRLAIASALLGKPEILILDEPTNGLDPKGISEIRELISQVASEGITVILASHMLDEVEKTCTHVAILKQGVLLSHGRVDKLSKGENTLEVKSTDMDKLHSALIANLSVLDIKKEENKYIIKLDKTVTEETITKYLFEKGVIVTHLVSVKNNLEKQFLEITK